MTEVQKHGFSFEAWVRATFFNSYEGSYMQKWDIPPEVNNNSIFPENFRNCPVSVKAIKYGSPIGLGDILRQRSTSVPFLMIVGFWKQRNMEEKWFEEIEAVLFSTEMWSELWGDLTIEKISPTDTAIKNLNLPFLEARMLAQKWKRGIAMRSGSTIVVNPKIDSKRQRRIQCSLPFRAFWECAGRKPAPHDAPSLFGLPFPNPISSGPRQFNRS